MSVRDLFAAWQAAFNARDPASLRACWPADLARPFYLAEENGHYMRDWAELDDYWEALRTLPGLRACWTLTEEDEVAPGLVLAGFDLWWWLKPPSGPETAGDVRGAALCVATADGWRFRAYVEAPLAPIVYLRGLYAEKAAAYAGREP